MRKDAITIRPIHHPFAREPDSAVERTAAAALDGSAAPAISEHRNPRDVRTTVCCSYGGAMFMFDCRVKTSVQDRRTSRSLADRYGGARNEIFY
jgi:hypothetical protein